MLTKVASMINDSEQKDSNSQLYLHDKVRSKRLVVDVGILEEMLENAQVDENGRKIISLTENSLRTIYKKIIYKKFIKERLKKKKKM